MAVSGGAAPCGAADDINMRHPMNENQVFCSGGVKKFFAGAYF
ncbi:Hypothetical protein ETEE_0721 [Edwardsiella anguillarum ET080813]|uniref:Uncharacterized protein n=1 Tax=Edwardsiella anguillarum ET080813 TaxID=667120 RepID=A0A076LK42_9GAMM|nr:Hypothetical protein ETEE_0721 [Edwardsiella anguillarum ET080813]